MKLWTLTNEFAEVITDTGIVKAPIEYLGEKKIITLDNKCYFINKLVKIN